MSTWRGRIPEIERLYAEGKNTREIAIHFGCSHKTARNRIGELRAQGLLKPQDSNRPTLRDVATLPDYREQHEILPDSSHKSDKLLKLDSARLKDVEYILNAHGFDPKAWDLISCRNNVWNTNDKVNGVQTLYASKIHVRPMGDGLTFQQFVDAIKSEVKPVHFDFDSTMANDGGMLEIPLYDMHLGNCDFAYYERTQKNVANRINLHRWQEIIFIIGQDLMHHDNFKSSTANGTIIANADMKQAVEDAKKFYYPLIELAAKQAKGNVKIIYSKGNHDESMSYMFVQVLKERYPQLKFDDDIQERKVHVFGKNFIGITHGDKARKVLSQLFPAEFPFEWASTTFREIHAGDLHREDLKGHDEFGVMFRTLSTKNKTDDWHSNNGYTTAHKRFMLFEYSEEWLEGVKYV